jgi:Tfp pilus assembly ATPase PilU
MKYVVAEARFSNGELQRMRAIMSQNEWQGLAKLNVGWVKLFEAETVAEAEALEALLPPAERVDKNINRS